MGTRVKVIVGDLERVRGIDWILERKKRFGKEVVKWDSTLGKLLLNEEGVSQYVRSRVGPLLLP